MRQRIYILLLLLFIFNGSYAQNVEVQGQLKIVNGTQGAGKFLMSDAAGNSNWVTSDRLLIESQKLKKGGTQRLLDWEYDPYILWQNGVRYDSLIGKTFQKIIVNNSSGGWWLGGVIYYIDTLDQYPWRFAVADVENSYHNWGCSGTAITAGNGASSDLVWQGVSNTQAVLTQCPGSGAQNSATSNIFRQVLLIGLDWKVASKGDATLIYNTLIATGKWTPSVSDPQHIYWLSTEATGTQEPTHAWRIDKSNGSQSLGPKTAYHRSLNYKTYN